MPLQKIHKNYSSDPDWPFSHSNKLTFNIVSLPVNTQVCCSTKQPHIGNKMPVKAVMSLSGSLVAVSVMLENMVGCITK